MSKKKKIIILSCMIVLLAATAVFNFVLSSPAKSAATDAVPTANYFSEYRSERSASRSEQLLQLDPVAVAVRDLAVQGGQQAAACVENLKTICAA